MNPLLAKKLIERGAIRQGTIFQAYYKAHGLSGLNDSSILESFYIHSAGIRPDGTVCFTAYDSEKKEIRRFMSTEIITMDGMDIQRTAKTYNLAVDGNDAVSGKRRGRKPRQRE